MEEDTNKTGTNVPSHDGDKGDAKKVSIKFANNPKVLNMCQLGQDIRALPTKTPFSFPSSTSLSTVSLTTATSPTTKSIAATTSLLKKLPGNISVSTQKIVMPQQQQPTGLSPASLIPNKPVVVQPINPTTGASSGSNVVVSTARKIVFTPGDSRFLKIVNATPEQQSTITPGKKVIVQRVEQIQPPHAKNVVVSGTSAQISPMKQNKVIVVSGSKPLTSIVQQGKTKTQDDSYIVNEMPPEMRTKAIVVSSNNPTGDSQSVLQKVMQIPDPGKVAPVTITKKLLPLLPKPPVVTSPAKDKLVQSQVTSLGPSGTKTTFRSKR